MTKNTFIIKRLTDNHKEAILSHYKELDEESRYNRFCSSTNDSALMNHVSKIDTVNHGFFGVFNEDLHIVGLGECVFFSGKNQEKSIEAEVAFSILSSYQGCGLGNRLLQRLIRFAKINEVTKMHMYCLRNNNKVIHLCKKYGLQVEVNPYESSAYLNILPEDIRKEDRMEEIAEDILSEIAISKQRSLRFNTINK